MFYWSSVCKILGPFYEPIVIILALCVENPPSLLTNNQHLEAWYCPMDSFDAELSAKKWYAYSNTQSCWSMHQPEDLTLHYDDVIMTMLASQITSLPVVCSIVYSDVNQRKHQSSASLAFVREIHRGPVNFPHKWPVTRKMFPFDDVIMIYLRINCIGKCGRTV